MEKDIIEEMNRIKKNYLELKENKSFADVLTGRLRVDYIRGLSTSYDNAE